MNRRNSIWTLLLVLGTGLLFALGINGYIMPESTDDLIYMEGARNLVAHGTYTSEGLIIADWPPIHSLLLAGVFLITGSSSIVVGKTVSVAMAMLSLYLICRLFTAEKRRFMWPALVVFAMLPTGFLSAVRSGSDWTYIALSLLFLLLLKRLSTQRGLGLALLCGLVLGAASLTRYVGVLMGIAVIAQALWLILGRQKLAFWKVWPEALIGLVGGAIWVSWPVFLRLQPEGTVAPGHYELAGSSLLSNFYPLDLFDAVGDYFAQLPDVLDKLGLGSGPMGTVVSALLATFVLSGFIRSVALNGFRASDYYVIAYMALICSYEWKLPRFFIPVGPWLIIYLMEGMAFLGALFTPRSWALRTSVWQYRALATVWCGMALLMNLVLVFRGHPGKLHGPLFAAATSGQETFYGDFYRELQKTGALLAKLPEGTVIATEGFYANYLSAYSGRLCIDPRLHPGTRPDVFVEIHGYQESDGLPEFARNWPVAHEIGKVRVLAPGTLAFSPLPSIKS